MLNEELLQASNKQRTNIYYSLSNEHQVDSKPKSTRRCLYDG